MTSVYDSDRLAAGYAFDRPPVHAQILRRLRLPGRTGRALDVGCGAGLSTAALAGLADVVVGMEPVPTMLIHRRKVAPQARFVVGSAERLPFGSATFDLVTAAGSLNYVDLGSALSEAARVLTPDGRFVIYDFSEGRHASESERLATWFVSFEQRFPWPLGYNAIAVREFPFAEAGLSLDSYEDVEITLPLTLESYLRYVLSEVNVDSAVAAGASEAAARDWCRSTLAEVFGSGTLNVIFKGYIASVRRT